jgi:DNA repair ATPase RecN
VQLLDEPQRIREIAELLSGKHITETAAAAAKELLFSAQTTRQTIINHP